MILLARKVLPVTAPDIDNGAIVVRDGSIADIGRRRDILKRHRDRKVVDLGRAVIMPGLVNAHTHLELSHLHGMIGEKEDFFEWIQELVSLRRRIGLKGAERAARAALRQAADTGTTCVGDISATGSAVPAILKMGIRARVYLEVLGLDQKTAQASYKSFKDRMRGLEGSRERIKAGVSPHSTYSVSSSLYKKIQSDMLSNGLNVAIHISETLDESLYIKGRPSRLDGYMKGFGWDKVKRDKYESPLRFVEEMGLIKGLLAVHAVHVSRQDIRKLKKAGASVAHCPRSNHLLKVGKAPVEEMLAHGLNVAIGTDSLASNLDLNLWEEMRFAYLVNRIKARQVIEMATINGARALGFGDVTGSLEPGKKADIIALETDAAKADEPSLPLLMDGGKGNVIFTMVDGKVL